LTGRLKLNRKKSLFSGKVLKMHLLLSKSSHIIAHINIYMY